MSAADLTLAELEAFETRDELVNEYARRTAIILGMGATPTWRWTENNRGRASDLTFSFVMPDWLSGKQTPWWPGHRSLLFLAYYAAHEAAHLAKGSVGHGERFKSDERRVLAELGIGIKYMRNYPAVLFDLETREELYLSERETQRRERAVVMSEKRERALELLAAGQEPSRIGVSRMRGGRRVLVGDFDGEWLPMPTDEQVIAARG